MNDSFGIIIILIVGIIVSIWSAFKLTEIEENIKKNNKS